MVFIKGYLLSLVASAAFMGALFLLIWLGALVAGIPTFPNRLTPTWPTPTATTTATQTPPPTYGTVNSGANIRQGPGTNYPIVGGAHAGQVITLTGRNQAGDWLQLSEGQWIAATLVAAKLVDLPTVNVPLAHNGPSPADCAEATNEEWSNLCWDIVEERERDLQDDNYTYAPGSYYEDDPYDGSLDDQRFVDGP